MRGGINVDEHGLCDSSSRLPIIAMILRPSSDRVTRKHCIELPTIEAIVMMKKLLRHVLDAGRPKMLPNCSPKASAGSEATEELRRAQ